MFSCLAELALLDQVDQAGHAFARVDGIEQDAFRACATSFKASTMPSVGMP